MLKLYSPIFLTVADSVRQKLDECQITALSNVLENEDDKNLDYILRHIFRKYSEYFLTPLHIVEQLPLEMVLINYYEYLYETFSKEDKPEIQQLLEKERIRLSETKEEREARILKEKEDLVSDEQLLLDIAEENKQAAIQQAKRLQKQAEALSKELEKDSLSFSQSRELSTFNGPIDFKVRSKIDSPDVRLPGSTPEQSIKQSVPSIVYEELRELDGIEGYD